MGYYYPQAAMTLKILWEDGKLKSDASLQKTYSLPVLAKSVTVTINDYSVADTFECEIDYKNFPFDPRCIRACGVTVHMQDSKSLFGKIELDSILPTTKNTVFTGFADEDSITFDDTKRSVKLSGRDFTALLIDKPYADGSIALTDRLDVLIQKILDDLKETQPLTLDVRGRTKESLPVLSTFDESHQLNGKKSVDRHENYWEVIQDLVARAGLIAFIDLDKLVITSPRSLYDAGGAKVFIYGRNIKNLTFKRKIGRKKFFNVIVRSLIGKDVIDARIPLEATAEWSKATGVDRGEQKTPEVGPKGEAVDKTKWKPAPYMSFRVPKIKDKDHLIQVAQNIYEEIGRQQIEGSFETKEMAVTQLHRVNGNLVDSYDEVDPDFFSILKIRNGTPIQVKIDQGDLKGISSLASVAERADYLKRRGYDDDIANAFAKTMNQFADVYYTKQVRFTIDNQNGFQAQIEFLNFVDTKISGAG